MRDEDRTKQGLINDAMDLPKQIDELREKESNSIQKERVLLKNENGLELPLVAAHIGIWEWDIGRNHMVWVRNVEAISGHSRVTFEGTYEDFLNFVHPGDRPIITQSVRSALEKADGGNCYEVEFRIIMPNGKVWWNYGRGQVIRDEAGRPVRMLGVGMDITERKNREETLRSLSLIDELTGLHNRRQFFNLAEQQLKVAIRTKKKLLLLFIDLDGLKLINDLHGHNWGDLALIDIANILKETFRESDIIARIGGDEFVVLAVESADINYEILATRLQKNVDAHNAKGSRFYKLSISVGIAKLDPEHPISVDDLLTQADTLMYEEKRKKQNYIQRPFIFDNQTKKMPKLSDK